MYQQTLKIFAFGFISTRGSSPFKKTQTGYANVNFITTLNRSGTEMVK